MKTRGQYFNLSKKISKKVDLLILSEFKKYPISSLCFDIFSKREGKNKLRSTLVYLMSLLKGEKIRDEKIYIIPELSNYRLYLSNMLLDNKNNILCSRESINNAILDIHIIDGIVLNLTKKINPYYKNIWRLYSEVNFDCHLGQQIEVNNNLTSFQGTEKDFWSIYNKKSYLMSGKAYGFSASVINYPEGVDFLEKFGTYLHITNDICDFVLPETSGFKNYQDVFSDLREDRLNPIYYFSQLNKGSINSGFENIDIPKKVIKKCLSFNKKNFNYLKKYMKNSFSGRKDIELLSVLISIIKTNKGVHQLRKLINKNYD